MTKRGRLEIIYDILEIIRNSRAGMKPTPLLRKSNLSSARFKGYYLEMIGKGFLRESNDSGERRIFLTDKGSLFLEKYKVISNFVDEFGL